jgi:RNA polymerase sigma-70 factor (ECF subfamily)
MRKNSGARSLQSVVARREEPKLDAGDIEHDRDREDVRRVLAGDSQAFGAIVARHDASLRRLLAGIIADRTLAEDVLQEVYLRVYRGLAAFRSEARFATWMHRIAVREAISARTRWRRFVGRFGSAGADEPTSSAAAATRGVDAGDELLVKLGRLPAAERAAIVLHAEGWSYADIAAAVGCPVGTVSVRIHRARGRLAGAGEVDVDERNVERIG